MDMEDLQPLPQGGTVLDDAIDATHELAEGDIAISELVLVDGEEEIVREAGTSIRLGEERYYPGVDALLYGHNHAAKVRNGAWDIPRCYDAGTATGKGDGVIRHRVIDLSRDPRWDYNGDFL